MTDSPDLGNGPIFKFRPCRQCEICGETESAAFTWHGHLGHELRYTAILAGTPANQQERSDLPPNQGKDRCALVDSIRVRIEIAVYREQGQDAHATFKPPGALHPVNERSESNDDWARSIVSPEE